MHAAAASNLVDIFRRESLERSNPPSPSKYNVRMKQENELYSFDSISSHSNKGKMPSNAKIIDLSALPSQGIPFFLEGEPHPVILTDENCVKAQLSEELYALVMGFKQSHIWLSTNNFIQGEIESNYGESSEAELATLRGQNFNQQRMRFVSVPGWTQLLELQFRGANNRLGANSWDQFRILSARMLKNLYRNPDLLQTHYVISIIIAFISGVLFWKVDNTLAGFQNRLGVFFFICALFGFSCLSSMQVG
jgi:hypothetical protein